MNPITKTIAVFIAAGFFAAAPAAAGGPHAGFTGRPGMPAAAMMHTMHNHLVLPMEIVHHQQELDLNADQKAFIKKHLQDCLSEMAGLNWELQEAIQELEAVVREESVDEKTAAKKLEKILELENAIKKNRFLLMVRIKNKLEPQQLEKLRELKAESPARGAPKKAGQGRKNGPPKKRDALRMQTD